MERSQTWPAVVFDIGGVLTTSEGGVPELSRMIGVEPERFSGPYWEHRLDYDRGSLPTEYWPKVARDLGLEWSDEELARIDLFDARRWSQIAPGRLEILTALQRGGVTTALLSNAPASMARIVKAADWSAGFDERFFSCDLGLIKPEAKIYEVVEERLGAQLVFFDDRPPNIEAARARGWQAHLWTTPEACREVLDGLGLPTP
ncbi:HAD family hydrolase [Kineosporia succinea]|uniref:Hydrolase of the HAD superfamily n=1 Tax=Kineosporia succinea TaxID=84632 RepID=A0ABT9P264_9ACTN|nr:HAD family phosphatase [Kineosporia succinea]MDP9826320.1 putative hydrolase of the HAD superfamily [Kineosporia succinea]